MDRKSDTIVRTVLVLLGPGMKVWLRQLSASLPLIKDAYEFSCGVNTAEPIMLNQSISQFHSSSNTATSTSSSCFSNNVVMVANLDSLQNALESLATLLEDYSWLQQQSSALPSSTTTTATADEERICVFESLLSAIREKWHLYCSGIEALSRLETQNAEISAFLKNTNSRICQNCESISITLGNLSELYMAYIDLLRVTDDTRQQQPSSLVSPSLSPCCNASVDIKRTPSLQQLADRSGATDFHDTINHQMKTSSSSSAVVVNDEQSVLSDVVSSPSQRIDNQQDNDASVKENQEVVPTALPTTNNSPRNSVSLKLHHHHHHYHYFDPLDHQTTTSVIPTGAIRTLIGKLYRPPKHPTVTSCPYTSVLQSMDDPLPDAFSNVPEDYDHWDQLKAYYQTVIHMADFKAVEYRMDYQKAMLELEAKCVQMSHMKQVMNGRDKELIQTQDELRATTASFEAQIRVLSDHLADLNDKLASGSNHSNKKK
jgi:hypothetical protein